MCKVIKNRRTGNEEFYNCDKGVFLYINTLLPCLLLLSHHLLYRYIRFRPGNQNRVIQKFGRRFTFDHRAVGGLFFHDDLD